MRIRESAEFNSGEKKCAGPRGQKNVKKTDGNWPTFGIWHNFHRPALSTGALHRRSPPALFTGALHRRSPLALFWGGQPPEGYLPAGLTPWEVLYIFCSFKTTKLRCNNVVNQQNFAVSKQQSFVISRQNFALPLNNNIPQTARANGVLTIYVGYEPLRAWPAPRRFFVVTARWPRRGHAVVTLSRKGKNIRNSTLAAEAGGPAPLSRCLEGKNIRNLPLAAEAGGPAVVSLSRRSIRNWTLAKKTIE